MSGGIGPSAGTARPLSSTRIAPRRRRPCRSRGAARSSPACSRRRPDRPCRNRSTTCSAAAAPRGRCPGRELRLQLAADERLVDELGGHVVEHVDLAVEEREPARLPLLDDADLDAPGNRQALALERRGDRLRRRRDRPRRRVGHRAESGIGDAARFASCACTRPACTARCRPDARRYRCRTPRRPRARAPRVRHRERIEESAGRPPQPDPQRVAVDDLEPGDRRVVVELAGLRGLRARLVAADDLALDQPRPRALDRRVEQPLEAVGLVGRGQLARLALERGIGREEDAFATLQI